MSFPVPTSIDELLAQAEAATLYQNLIDQLNKDLTLANEAVDFPKSTTPYELRVQLQEKIFRLISYRFSDYLNLLYVIDVPEQDVRALDGSDLASLSESVAFLVLKRVWQKVWFRNHFAK